MGTTWGLTAEMPVKLGVLGRIGNLLPVLGRRIAFFSSQKNDFKFFHRRKFFSKMAPSGNKLRQKFLFRKFFRRKILFPCKNKLFRFRRRRESVSISGTVWKFLDQIAARRGACFRCCESTLRSVRRASLTIRKSIRSPRDDRE